jgi:hypothetical protein
MSELYPVTFFFLIALIWLVTALHAHRMGNTFVRKYPAEAGREIPYAHSKMRHPEKLFYFFRRKSVALLRGDPELWRMRQQLILLIAVSFLLPISLFTILLVIAIKHGLH